jgi:hypothetical protein
MKGIETVKTKFRRLAWLFLGLCFVVLYSCPVKKFLLFQFDKTCPPGAGSSHFRKNLSFQSPKIVYLNRNSTGYKTVAATRACKPVMPPRLYASPGSFPITEADPHLPAQRLLQLSRQRAFTIGPPSWLQSRRWQI